MRRLLTDLLAMAILAMRLTAQKPASSAGSAHVHGVIYDSLTRRVLSGAGVQLLGTSQAGDDSSAFSRFATTDERGEYRLDDIPPGTYVLGFFHPSLDSLGLDLPPRTVQVEQDSDVRVNLAVPSHSGAIAMFCGRSELSDTTALIVGFVRDAETSRPVTSASVLLQWTELVIGGGPIRQEGQQLQVGTREDGWYALCNVPVSELMELRVARGADSSGAVAANLVGRQVARRDLYVGPSERIVRVRPDSIARDSVFEGPAVVWKGRARLVGTVRRRDGTPLGGARVAVNGSESQALTNESGGFVLVDLPSGSQTLQVRALGFLPERITVQLLTGGAGSENVATVTLASLRSVLDTIRVTASRVFSSDVNGFESRKRSGLGHYVDRAAIEKKQPLNASDMLRMIPGVQVLSAGVGFFGRVLAMRSPFKGGMCRPDLYVDGMHFRSGDAELDELVNPDEIDGIEVYTRQTQAPMQYADRMSGCGSVVVWTHKAPRRWKKPKKPSD